MKPDKEKPKATPIKKPESSKVFDVSRPGKALASPTSKPVISVHRPIAQEAQAAVSGVGEPRPLMTRRKIQIVPTGDLASSSVAVATPAMPSKEAASAIGPASPDVQKTAAQPTLADAEALAATALDAVTGAPELSDDAAPKPVEPSKLTKIEAPEVPDSKANRPAVEPEVETETPPDAEVEPISKAEPKLSEKELPAESSSMPEVEPVEETPEKEELPPEPVIEPLFDDSGAIVVSNHEHHKRHHGVKATLLVLLILLLAVVAFDIALDLDLLQIEGVPHTDFL